jgi:hypothetical protein
MTAWTDDLRLLAQQLAHAPPTDAEGVLAALDRLTELREAAEQARRLIADHARPLIEQALRAGVHRADLAKRPYSSTVVHQIADEIGIPPRKPGPAPRRRATESQ